MLVDVIAVVCLAALSALGALAALAAIDVRAALVAPAAFYDIDAAS